MSERGQGPRQQHLWLVEDLPEQAAPPPAGPGALPEEMLEAIDELLAPLADPLQAHSPLMADTSASAVAVGLRAASGERGVLGPPRTLDQAIAGADQPEPGVLDRAAAAIIDLVAERAAAGQAGYREALRALTAYGGPLAGPARATLADLDLDLDLDPSTGTGTGTGLDPGPNSDSPVACYAGQATVEAAYGISYAGGDIFELLLELGYPETADRPGYLLGFDTFDGPSLIEVDATDDTEELLAEMRGHAPLVEVERVPVPAALNTLRHALWVFDRTIGDTDLEDDGEGELVLHRPLHDHLIASQPPSDVLLGRQAIELTDRERDELAAELVSLVESNQPPSTADAATLATLLVDFGAERAGDPQRWTSTVAVRFLEFASTNVAAPPELLGTLPDIVRQAITWSATEKGWPAEITDDALEAVDQVEPLFLAALEADLQDDFAPSASLSALEGPAGGPHPEPFDGTGIDPELRHRAEAIAATAATLAGRIFDDEYATLVHRLVADTARHPETPFAKGKPNIWASAAVYAVAQVNDIPGGWGHLAMPATELTARLAGAPSTIVGKARTLRRLLDDSPRGLSPYQHSTSTLDLGTVFGELLQGITAWDPEMTAGPAGFDPTSVDDGCFVLRACLLDIRPEIWRRLRIPIDATFAQLHQLLQLTFGWYDTHLHEFDVEGIRVGPASRDLPFDLGEDPEADEATTRLCDLLTPGSELVYTYDFGDDWQHLIEVEQLQLRGGDLEHGRWALLGGERAGPPEDCGGPWGYRELLKAQKNRNHPRRSEVAHFLPPGFNPKHLDVATLNHAVQNRRWT